MKDLLCAMQVILSSEEYWVRVTSDLLFRKITLSEVWIETENSGKETSKKAIIIIQAREV